MSRVSGRSNLIDVEVTLVAETPQAVRVSPDGERRNAIWLPKSQCEVERGKGVLATVTLPEWLAIQKGLV